MRHRFLACSFVSLSALLLSGCLSTEISLDYVVNPSAQLNGPPIVGVGVFLDKRGEDEPKLLGTVKTPIGTPFEHVYLRIPADETVQNAVLHGLDARGMMASPSRARFVLEGSIEEFYCQLISRPYAYAKIRVDLVDTASNRVLYRHTYEAERQAGTYLPGEGDPVPSLRDLSSRVLQDVVDKAIDNPEVREWMGNPGRPDGPGHPRNARRVGASNN
ncbi:MAG: hypothetical protein JWO94_797 [Verrucomicrobiaceae bacterium]|nr:hypothetical protein [Verrucomicrobiaceae bacterium]